MKYFSLSEFIDSMVARRYGIDNTPSASAIANIEALVTHVLDPAREAFGAPVRVNSGYRCSRLNAAVGGTASSQHLRGEAADLTTGSLQGNKRLYEILCDLPHDQLIWERGNDKGPAWVHVSYKRIGDNRGEVLRL